MEKEIWKEIKGFEGRYAISNHGQVRSLPRCIHPNRCFPERLMKLHLQYNGYIAVWLRRPGKIHEKHYIHRLVASHFLENPECKEHVNHKNKDRCCNRLDNLEYMTPQENQHHKMTYKREEVAF